MFNFHTLPSITRFTSPSPSFQFCGISPHHFPFVRNGTLWNLFSEGIGSKDTSSSSSFIIRPVNMFQGVGSLHTCVTSSRLQTVPIMLHIIVSDPCRFISHRLKMQIEAASMGMIDNTIMVARCVFSSSFTF